MAESISRLLNKIENKQLVLPEFQREFTWNPDQAKKLIQSFLKDYPTGALLFWETKENIALKNMPNFDFDNRVEVLLDGQQRLTALYMFIKDSIPPYYNEKDIGNHEIRSLYYNLEDRKLEYYKPKLMQNDPRWVKVTDCFKSDKINSIEVAKKINNGEIDEEVLKKITRNLSMMQKIKEKEYSILYVKDSCDLREALTVFDRINSQGTPLSEADIALAHMCSRWADTRREFKKKLNELKKEGFSFDLTFLVRAMNAVINHRAEYHILHENLEEELKEGFKKLSGILDYLINVLKGRANIYGDEDLSTYNVLIPIIGYLSLYGPNFPDEKSLNKFLYWMYAALYKNRYSGSVDQKLEADLSCLKRDYTPEINPIEDLINLLKEEIGDPEIYKANVASRTVNHPLYNMLKIIIRARGGKDWANGLSLSKPFGKKYSVERHHIFPIKILKKKGYEVSDLHHGRLVHEIANRVPLTKSSNMEIFDSEPSKYLPIIEEKYPGNLEKFFIPKNPELWKVENYRQFLDKRRELIAEGINSFMNSLLKEELEEKEKSVDEIISKGESNNIEFKSSLRWDVKKEEFNKNLEKPILKTISAFLNTKGGILLIGVEDDGNIIGIEKDLEQFKNKDKYELHLSNLITNKIGNIHMPYIKINFETIDNKTICKIYVDKSSEPAYFRDEGDEFFYVRQNNRTKELPVSETKRYIEQNWK